MYYSLLDISILTVGPLDELHKSPSSSLCNLSDEMSTIFMNFHHACVVSQFRSFSCDMYETFCLPPHLII